jgi:cytochrome c oxidase subunit I
MSTVVARPSGGIFRRPSAKTGFWSWVTTVDHKRIGILYGYTAFFFFILGGLEALLIRVQLATPDGKLLTEAQYSQLFTMHGITMIFLVVMPMSSAFFNYLIPLMIGARDVAFPRLNAFSYWAFLFGGIFIYSSFLLGGAPNGGWFGYAPLSRMLPAAGNHGGLPGTGMTFYALGLQILGVASLASAANFITTILNMRAPGMTLMKMPMFIWMTLVVSFLLLFAMPVIAVALFQLMFDRVFATNFYNAVTGGDPVLWQHMFWLFGHPEVYILVLPAMGIVSEVLPVFSRKPLFGYTAVAFSGIAIGFMGWGVWAHHMFAVGLGPVANTAFALSTMFIAVPTGVKIFNWMGTMFRGSLKFSTPMLFAVGFIAMFTIGGLSGVTHAIVPSDYQQTDTYYVVAHFHYVLFGGALFGLFAGFYYWFPKVYGRLMDEKQGKVQFWLMLLGFNLTFAGMHILGLQGMPRRQGTYPPGMGWDFWNFVSTIGAFMIALSMLVFMHNWAKSKRKGKLASDDPWDGRTLEWSIPSPPPEHNFDIVPRVHERDEFWHRKYKEDKKGRPVPVPVGGSGEADAHGHGGHIHMPSPSYWPTVAAAGLPMMGWGVVRGAPLIAGETFQLTAMVAVLMGLGALTFLTGIFGWVLEPGTEPE